MVTEGVVVGDIVIVGVTVGVIDGDDPGLTVDVGVGVLVGVAVGVTVLLGVTVGVTEVVGVGVPHVPQKPDNGPFTHIFGNNVSVFNTGVPEPGFPLNE